MRRRARWPLDYEERYGEDRGAVLGGYYPRVPHLWQTSSPTYCCQVDGLGDLNATSKSGTDQQFVAIIVPAGQRFGAVEHTA